MPRLDGQAHHPISGDTLIRPRRKLRVFFDMPRDLSGLFHVIPLSSIGVARLEKEDCSKRAPLCVRRATEASEDRELVIHD